MPFEEPLVFQAEWFDSTSGLHRLFNLSFYTSDESVELYDLKTKKLFLRRAPAGYLTKKDLYIGNTVVIYSRHLLIKEFANEYTKNQVDTGWSIKNFNIVYKIISISTALDPNQ